MQNTLEVKYITIDEVKPYVGNARTHSSQQIKQITRSIEAFGFINPILIDSNKSIVAGHGRLQAAKSLGLQIIPCIRIDHLDDDERRAYILADNKLAENAEWDPDLLKIELTHLSQIEVDLDVELTGFSMPEIDIMMGSCEPVNDDPPVPDLPAAAETVVQNGDLWSLGSHRLICGDCRDPDTVNRLMTGDQARQVFTDPPYNVPIDGHARGLGQAIHPDFAMACGEMSSEDFTKFLAGSLEQLSSVSLEGSLHYICMDWRHMPELLSAGNSVFRELINLCIWNKSSGGMGSLYRSKHELVFIFKKGLAPHINNIELGKHGRNRANVWDYPGFNAFGQGRDEALAMHPTVKPVHMIADAILDTSKRGEIILDGFTGSGSTLLAVELTGRVFRGIEIDPRYIEVTLQRWINTTGEQPIQEGTGLTYAALVASRSTQSETCEV